MEAACVPAKEPSVAASAELGVQEFRPQEQGTHGLRQGLFYILDASQDHVVRGGALGHRNCLPEADSSPG
jgi:hypothetical protein